MTTAEADDDARLAAAVKSDDAFFPTYFISPWSKHVARWVARRGIAPNTVTLASFAMGLSAAGVFALGTRAALVAGAVLLQVSFALDCVDGQVARYAARLSALGGWLDAMFDRTKEYVVYAWLAIGSARAWDENVWALAGAALVLQTMRHLSDLDYHAAQPGGAKESDGGVARLSRLTDRSGWTRWPKRVLVLPIGERLLLVSVTAAVFRPWVTFVVLLGWGGVAAAYGLSGRMLRSLA